MPTVWDQFSDPVEADDWDAISAPVESQPAGDRKPLRELDPSEYDPSSPEYQEKYGATSTMGGAEKLRAGFGKAFVDLGRGAAQFGAGVADFVAPRQQTLSDLITADGESRDPSRVAEMRRQVEESRRLDAELMKSGSAKVGNLLGNVAATIPALAIPGANTVAGAGVVGAGLGLLQPSTSTKETLTNTAIGGAAGATAQYLGNKVAQWAGNRLSQRATAAATAKDLNAVRDATLKEAQSAGYVVPPSTTNPTVTNRVIEGVSGKAQTQQASALRNQQVTNRLVRQELGLSETAQITKETLNGVRSKAGAVYKAIAGAGDIAADSQYLDDLASIAQSIDDVAKDFPDLNLNNNAEIDNLVTGMLQDKFSAKSAIELTKQLRKSASGNLSGANAADPAKRALGYAQREAADAVEGQLIRHLEASGKGALAKQFDASRKLIAKTYSVESALNEGTGNVVATKLSAQLARNKPLSGNLELIAKFGQAFGKAAKEVTDSPGVSALDAMFGVAGGATLNPALVALPVARVATRGAITNPTINRILGTPSYAPGAIGSGVLKSAGKVGKYGSLPAAAELLAVQGRQ